MIYFYFYLFNLAINSLFFYKYLLDFILKNQKKFIFKLTIMFFYLVYTLNFKYFITYYKFFYSALILQILRFLIQYVNPVSNLIKSLFFIIAVLFNLIKFYLKVVINQFFINFNNFLKIIILIIPFLLPNVFINFTIL